MFKKPFELKKKALVIVLGFLMSCCSVYYGKEDENGRYRVNEKHWTLKNIPNEGVERVLDTEYWYRLEYSFTNDSFFFEDDNEKESTYNSDILWFFESGHVLRFTPYVLDDKEMERIKNGESNLDFGSQGFYTIGSNEFEIEFFQRQNVSIGGSMDRYYFQALLEKNTLHLVRKSPFKKNYYFHSIYKKEAIPEELKNIKKPNW